MAIGTDIDDLIVRVINEVAQVPGLHTQIYSEDRILEKINAIFTMAMDALWWPDYMVRTTIALDGTDGVSTTILNTIYKKYEDIRFVFPESSDLPLGELPAEINANRLTGTQALYIEQIAATADNANKVIQFWPQTAVGNFVVWGRSRPDTYVSGDTTYMDADVLKWGAAWELVEQDGTNPADAARLQSRFESRLKQLRGLQSNKPILLQGAARTEIPNTWR